MQMSSGFKRAAEQWCDDKITGWELKSVSFEASLQDLIDGFHIITGNRSGVRTVKEREAMGFDVAGWCVSRMLSDIEKNRPIRNRRAEKRPLRSAYLLLLSTQKSILVQGLYDHMWFTQNMNDRAALLWEVINEIAAKIWE